MRRTIFPFAAIVGQEELKQSLLLNAVNPRIGGVLIRGEKGTAKSTAVRALAALLPEIAVVGGCPFGCAPDRPDETCDRCRNSRQPLEKTHRQVRVVDLPLNATEDRVAGGIDFSLAVRQGRRALQPGLLAAAHRGILYVDEVNLLDDHIVDIVLDAAASGENIIEREGISFRHPSRFILVGTMNPEEGELRPQLLDRFGLCVETAGAEDLETRVTLMRRREEFDGDPTTFMRSYAEQNQTLARKIEAGRAQLSTVRMPRHLRGFISELCAENNVAGHRADLVIEQAALALAALEAAPEVTVDHIRRVAPMALVHRRREAQPPPPPPPEEDRDEANDQDQSQEDQQQAEQPPAPEDQTAESREPPDEASADDDHAAPEPEQGPPQPERQDERIFDIGATFKVKPISTAKDRVIRRGSGRRSRTRVSQKQGRYVKSCLNLRNNDIALDATLRAAAPYQRARRNGNPDGMAVVLTDQDIRGKIREKRIGNFLFFTVDASGSMGARGRMAASKGAIMSLLLDAYQKRDRVAMVSFRRDEAVVNLPPTPSVELAGKLLAEMPVGGRTPLSAGLVKTHEQVRNILAKDPSARPIVILITDGKSNVALGGGKPVEEALGLAAAMARDARVRHIVVDTEEEGLVTFGLARRLAAALSADYFKIETLKAQTLVNIVKEQRT
jgi:magnesium chelatase subunit D